MRHACGEGLRPLCQFRRPSLRVHCRTSSAGKAWSVAEVAEQLAHSIEVCPRIYVYGQRRENPALCGAFKEEAHTGFEPVPPP